MTSERYNAISHVIDKTVKRSRTGLTTSQKIDRVVTNRWLGLPIFIAIMFFVYWLAVTVGTGPVTDWANDGISGDGYLYTGQAAYEEAEGEYEDAQGVVRRTSPASTAWTRPATFRATKARKCLTRLPWPSPKMMPTKTLSLNTKMLKRR